MFWNKWVVDLISQKMSEVFHRRIADKIISLDKRREEAARSHNYSKAMKLLYRRQGLEASLKIFTSSKQEVWGK